jgi:hypothetical protein
VRYPCNVTFVRSHVLPFESLVMQAYLQRQFSLMYQLHEHEFILLLIDVPSNVVRTCLHSCAHPTIGAWLLAHPRTPSLCLLLVHFFTTLCICFSLPHPTIAHLPRYIMVIPLMICAFICYVARARMNALQPIIHFEILL